MLAQLAAIRRSTLASAGAVLFLFIFVAGAVAPLLIPASVVRDVQFGARLSPPSAQHWFGTDDFGRDLFSLVLLAATLDLRVALSGVLAGLLIGTVVGGVAGLVSRLDEPIMRA